VQGSSQIVTTNKPIPRFSQTRCPSCHPTNSVRAPKGEKETKETGINLRRKKNKSRQPDLDVKLEISASDVTRHDRLDELDWNQLQTIVPRTRDVVRIAFQYLATQIPVPIHSPIQTSCRRAATTKCPRPGLQVVTRYTSRTHMDRSPLLYVHVGLPVSCHSDTCAHTLSDSNKL